MKKELKEILMEKIGFEMDYAIKSIVEEIAMEKLELFIIQMRSAADNCKIDKAKPEITD